MSIVDGFIEDSPTVRRLVDFLRRVILSINGNIEFGAPNATALPTRGLNINGVFNQGTTPGVADQEFAVTHNMGRIPVGFITLSVDQNAAVLYKGVTAWTTKQLFLKCHQTSVNYVIFII